jgi:acyl-CoA reductase-like NAD-dependent aldehyde dehydrogenase
MPNSHADLQATLNHAADAATQAAGWMRAHSDQIARLLLALADALDQSKQLLIATAAIETNLLPAELEPELVRTIANLRSFSVLAARYPHASASVGGLQRVFCSLGPVAVFGASNFPLAYGYLGTDASSALAACCPVIVKAHPLQPRTYGLQAQIAAEVITKLALPPGVLQLIENHSHDTQVLGTALVAHPQIRAVGFTGSIQGGLALQRVTMQRPLPIPFYGELGSVNPQIILPEALVANAQGLASALAGSLIARAGQQCTCPGVWIVMEAAKSPHAWTAWCRSLREVLEQAPARALLAPHITKAYLTACERWRRTPGVSIVFDPPPNPSPSPTSIVRPCLLQTDWQTALNYPHLLEENFGPAAMIIHCDSPLQVQQMLDRIGGSLVASLWTDPASLQGPLSTALLTWRDTLAQQAGRVVLQGVPTGVQVSPLMHHGGPHPASTRPESTAVGDQAVFRWLRPVTLQNWV